VTASTQCSVPDRACCLNYVPGTDDFCVPANDPAACNVDGGSSTAVVSCDDSTDCLVGEVCCAQVNSSDNHFLGASCKTTCSDPSVRLCRDGGECAAPKKCDPWPSLDQYSACQ
jgi:hypothetical protein